MLAFVLAAVLAQADGGVWLTSPIYNTCPEAPALAPVMRCEGDGICQLWPMGDAGFILTPFSWPYEEDGGFLISYTRAQRLSCFVGACETDRQRLETIAQNSEPPPTWHYWAIGIAVAAAVGFGAGYFCGNFCLR